MKLPEHKCGLYLKHNQHRDVYQSAVDWCKDNDADNGVAAYDFASEEAKQRAIATDEIWTLQWYPNTPICCHMIAAPTLDELLSLAARYE